MDWLASRWWLLAPALLLAALAIPRVRRRLLQHRRRRAVEKAEARIDLGVPRFLLSRRARILKRLEDDPEVRRLVTQVATEEGRPEAALRRKVSDYAREIVPAFSVYFYFHLGYRLARGLLRLHYTVRTAHVDERAVNWAEKNSTVVMVLNHRSNMDVLLLNYLASQRSTLSHAAGEWARLWPFSLLVRLAGNYVVDRQAGDRLYRCVLARYVHMATRGGVHQAIFPEGELSRDGTLGPLKLGLLAYVIRAFDPDLDQDICFIPVAVNYDRVPEDARLIADPDKVFKQRGKLHLALASLRYIGAVCLLPLRRRHHRFGTACASFGQPVSLRGWLAERGLDWRRLDADAQYRQVEALAGHLMDRVAAMIPALPVPIVASALTKDPGRHWSKADLRAAVDQVIAALKAGNAHVYPPGGDADAVAESGVRMLIDRGLIEPSDRGYRARPQARRLIEYYGNSIAHLIGNAVADGS